MIQGTFHRVPVCLREQTKCTCYMRRITPDTRRDTRKEYPSETFNVRLSYFISFSTIEAPGKKAVASTLRSIARYEGRSAWYKKPAANRRRTENGQPSESGSMCVHSFSRVWRNKGRSGSPRSFARHSEKAGSQPKKSRYCAPPYRRLPVFGQSLPNSRRSPPSGTTPSLRRLDVEPRYQRPRGTRTITQGRFLPEILPIARTRATRGAKEKW